ncbi:MAG: 4'-phosphopantetheinyl transferase superfamily protein [Eubacteriales bacterium]|nr:4'-phosphopantetheinyl transferase superfamily protein [Eubacteriales bacterium]
MIKVYYKSLEPEEGESQYKMEHKWGRKLLRYGLEQILGKGSDADQMMERLAYGKYGKPFFREGKGIEFSISHCPGWVLCALSEERIGIDIEKIADFPASMVRRVLSPEEQNWLEGCHEAVYAEAFYSLWTAKESCLKWSGKGFYQDPRDVIIEYGDWNQGASQWRGEILDQAPLYTHQRKWDKDCIISICCEKKEVEIEYEPYEKEMDGPGGQLSD